MIRAILSLLAVAALCTGCASNRGAQPAYFVLDPGQPPALGALGRRGSVAVSFVDVAFPASAGGFLYRLNATQWETDPYNQFLVSPSQMMTSLIRQWLAETGMYRFVAEAADGGGQDWNLVTEVTDFYGDFQNPFSPKAVLRMRVQAFRVDDGRRVLVFNRVYEQSVPVDQRRPEALVEAWNIGLREILLQLTRDLAK